MYRGFSDLDFADYNQQRYEAIVADHVRQRKLAADAREARRAPSRPTPGSTLWDVLHEWSTALRTRLALAMQPAEDEGYIA